LNGRCRDRFARRGAHHLRKRGAGRLPIDFAIRRNQQRRVPPQSSARRWPRQIIQPADTSPTLLREVSSAISGFRSLCGRQRRSSLKPSRSIGPAFWNLSIGAGSRSENSGLYPRYPRGHLRGQQTLGRRYDRKVVAPAGYSKWFFCTIIGLYGGNFRPATARGIPARSALGALSWVNPAAVIKASMSLLWPCPTSTTKTAPGARAQAACGISTR
jgi:hypothetical protein